MTSIQINLLVNLDALSVLAPDGNPWSVRADGRDNKSFQAI